MASAVMYSGTCERGDGHAETSTRVRLRVRLRVRVRVRVRQRVRVRRHRVLRHALRAVEQRQPAEVRSHLVQRGLHLLFLALEVGRLVRVRVSLGLGLGLGVGLGLA